MTSYHHNAMRSGTSKLVAADLYNVPKRSNQLDRRLPTEQMDALRAKLKVVDMRLKKAHATGNKSKIATLSALQGRLHAAIQRIADEIVNKQWPRDDRWYAKQGQG